MATSFEVRHRVLAPQRRTELRLNTAHWLARRGRRYLGSGLASVLVAFCPLPARSAELVVSPSGQSATTGSVFATIEQARDALRARPPACDGPVVIRIEAGTYRATTPLVFDARDAGKARCPRIYRGTGHTASVISGALPVPRTAIARGVLSEVAAKAGDAQLIALDLEALGDLQTDSPELTWEPGQPTTRAFLPELYADTFSATMARTPDSGFDRKDLFTATRRSTPTEQSIVSRLESGASAGLDGLETLYHGFFFLDWYSELVSLSRRSGGASYGRGITVRPSLRYPIGKAQRYRVLNAASALTAAGEYLMHAAGKRAYVLQPAAQSETRYEVSTNATTLLRLRDTSHLRFEALGFTRTRAVAITVEQSSDIAFVDTAVSFTGADGVVVTDSRRIVLDGIAVHDTGANGIYLAGGERASLTSADSVIRNCTLSRPGRIRTAPSRMVELWGVGHTVSGCRFEDGPARGLNFQGNNHTIARNHFSNLGFAVSDVSMVYTGRDWAARGSVVENNYFENIYGLHDNIDTSAVYLDDYGSGLVVRGNVFRDLERAILIGGGRDNVVEHNLFVDCRLAVDIDERGVTWGKKMLEPGGKFRKRLQKLPYRGKLWAKAYPKLVDVLDNHPAHPVGNMMVGNQLVGCKAIRQTALAKGYTRVEGNREGEVERTQLDEALRAWRRDPGIATLRAHGLLTDLAD